MTSQSVPDALSHLKNYIRLAEDHDTREPLIAYQARLFAAQKGMNVEGKGDNEKRFLAQLLDSLELSNKHLADRKEILSNEDALRQYIEQYTVRIFLHADDQDRSGRCDRTLVRMFFSVGLLFDICESIKPLDDRTVELRKIARAKAAQMHSALQHQQSQSPDLSNRSAIDHQPSSQANQETSMYVSFHNVPQNLLNNINQEERTNRNLYFDEQVPPTATKSNLNGSPVSSLYGFTGAALASQGLRPSHQSDTTLQNYSASIATKPKFVSEEQRTAALKQGERFCRFALSALQYEDIKTACDNLEKALDSLAELRSSTD